MSKKENNQSCKDLLAEGVQITAHANNSDKEFHSRGLLQTLPFSVVGCLIMAFMVCAYRPEIKKFVSAVLQMYYVEEEGMLEGNQIEYVRDTSLLGTILIFILNFNATLKYT